VRDDQGDDEEGEEKRKSRYDCGHRGPMSRIARDALIAVVEGGKHRVGSLLCR
jgi:hypothetical protein